MGEPDELVGAAIFLASDESVYVTGHVLHLDGGANVLGWTSAQAPVVRAAGGGG
jgi:NAD(P)-dependent dehydrogenase (short-subunit alcohol dehydrogenase family)